MGVTLDQVMAAEGHTLSDVARLAGVCWRSARDARAGRLRRPVVARKIADVYRDRRGRWRVDPASMLCFGSAQETAA